MCTNNNILEAENGEIYFFWDEKNQFCDQMFWSSTGRKNSEDRPNGPDNSNEQTKIYHMDEAISKTGSNQVTTHKKCCLTNTWCFQLGFGLFNYFVISVSGLILYAVVLETCAILYVMPVSQCDMRLSASQKGVLTGTAFFGVICSSHLWGYLADTKGRHCVIQPTLFIAFILTISCSFVQNFYVFITLRFFSGFLLVNKWTSMWLFT